MARLTASLVLFEPAPAITGTRPRTCWTTSPMTWCCSSCEKVALSPVVPHGTMPWVPSAMCQSTIFFKAAKSTLSSANGVTMATMLPLNCLAMSGSGPAGSSRGRVGKGKATVDSAAVGDDSARMPPFVALFGLGACALAVAVAVLPQMFAPGADSAALGGVLATRVLVQLGLLAMAVLIGCRLAPQVALRSHAARLAPRWNRREVGEALLAGVLVGMVVVGLSALLGTPTGDARIAVGPRALLRLELARAVHLGVFNELVMRWGAMSFLTLVVASARRRAARRAPRDRLVAAFAAAILETRAVPDPGPAGDLADRRGDGQPADDPLRPGGGVRLALRTVEPRGGDDRPGACRTCCWRWRVAGGVVAAR